MTTGTDSLLLIASGAALLLFAILAVVAARRWRRGTVRPPRRSTVPALPAAPPPDAQPQIPVPARGVAPQAAAASDRPPFEPWRLVERLLANPHSAGGPLYRLCFAGEYGVMPRWQPGAVAHIYCGPAAESRTGPAPIGEYMIGSNATDGLLDLVVRLVPGDDPSRGCRSRFLCETIQPGDMVAIALRDEPAFMPPPGDVPMILIGNATGIAGLHAHIRARPAGTRNWLIYGDRNSSGDRALAAELTGWLQVGHLERCDLVLPGEGQARRHVVDQLADARETVLDWLLAGSSIYVCGSTAMGNDIDSALAGMLGAEALTAMTEAGLYRRATY